MNPPSSFFKVNVPLSGCSKSFFRSETCTRFELNLPDTQLTMTCASNVEHNTWRSRITSHAHQRISWLNNDIYIFFSEDLPRIGLYNMVYALLIANVSLYALYTDIYGTYIVNARFTKNSWIGSHLSYVMTYIYTSCGCKCNLRNQIT